LATTPTEAECQADYQDMLTAIEKNRNSALTEITTQLFSVLPHQKETLEKLREQVWMQEKTERRQADFFRRDCLKGGQLSPRTGLSGRVR